MVEQKIPEPHEVITSCGTLFVDTGVLYLSVNVDV